MHAMFRVLITVAVVICLSAESHATLVRWTLNDVYFEDTGAASGYFTIDTESTTGLFYSGYDITTTPGIIVGGRRYAQDPNQSNGYNELRVNGGDVEVSIGRTGIGFNLLLRIDADVLNTTNGTFGFLPVSSIDCAAPEPCSAERWFFFSSRSFRPIFGGTVSATAIPEPSVFESLGLAIGLLVIVRKRWGRTD